MAPTRLGVDVGGTFTDLVALSKGGVTTSKVPSTPRDQSIGVMNAIGASGVEPGALDALAHGMTVATNALHRKPRVGVGRSVQLRLPALSWERPWQRLEATGSSSQVPRPLLPLHQRAHREER
jgi:predicted NBD/HSP70 family sugar kinase